MDARERISDIEEQARAAFDAAKADMWTSVPCTVESVDYAKQTCVLRPSIKSVARQPDGTLKAINLPLLQDVPIHFPSGGGVTMTFPIKKGDETLAVMSSRSIDGWHQSGGEQGQTAARTHSLSDAFAFVGFKSKPNAISNVSPSATQIRSNDGKTVVGLDPASGVSISTDQAVGVSAAKGVTMTGGSGKVTMTGEIVVNGDIILNGISLKDHVHSGVAVGGGNTGAPVG